MNVEKQKKWRLESENAYLSLCPDSRFHAKIDPKPVTQRKVMALLASLAVAAVAAKAPQNLVANGNFTDIAPGGSG
jgi:hypothetical protein